MLYEIHLTQIGLYLLILEFKSPLLSQYMLLQSTLLKIVALLKVILAEDYKVQQCSSYQICIRCVNIKHKTIHLKQNYFWSRWDNDYSCH